ncbi:MAG: Eco57I restriction-modification methylase domain-containing protein [Promethearchaeota archaeon]
MNNSANKELGVVLTPNNTADYIISRIGPIKLGKQILDPCVGPGVFINSLLKSGINPDQIFAFDINSEYKEEIENLGISFTTCDTLLSINPDSYNQFDYIVGNPPYLNKSSSYVRRNRKELKKVYGNINAHETYSMFIVNSIWRLKEGGKLGFITSDSFLTLSTHRKLRNFILENCIINEILLAPRDLFSNQNVNTSPVIIILTKCTGRNNQYTRDNNQINVIPRINNEEDYWKTKISYQIKQIKYQSLPFNIFFTNIEDSVIKLFEEAPKLKSYVIGYIGMHTHNNKKYIAAIKGTELANIFRKRNNNNDTSEQHLIISKEELRCESWKPYLKRGGNDQYYRPIMEALKWDNEAISIYDIPKNVPFENEGIVISGISSRLAARYMPKGCYWDSNKAIGFLVQDDGLSINYVLGLLNSSFYNYLAKGIINNTNSIQITGIHELPIILPDLIIKREVETLVNRIILNLKKNINYNFSDEQKQIDQIVYNFYDKQFNFPKELKQKLDESYSIY